MNAIGKKKVNGVDFSVEVAGNNIKVTSNKAVTLEDMFAAADEMLGKKNYSPKTSAFFDDMGDLVIKEKVSRHSVKTTRYNLDKRTSSVIIPMQHVIAYGNATDMAFLSNF